MSDMETELKNLIVTHLMLEDVTADEIDSDAPIFGDGLGLTPSTRSSWRSPSTKFMA